MRRALCGVAVAGTLASVGVVSAASMADSFTPVRLGITVAQTARKGAPLPITVAVSADGGALDGNGAMLVQVKLASECGGSYLTTTGTVLLNHALTPQPATGQPYSGSVRGAGRPTQYGVQTVCVFIDDASDHRQYATSQDFTVNVSKPCTTTAAAYDRAARAVSAAQRRHAAAAVIARAKTTAARDRGSALKACGSGVAL